MNQIWYYCIWCCVVNVSEDFFFFSKLNQNHQPKSNHRRIASSFKTFDSPIKRAEAKTKNNHHCRDYIDQRYQMFWIVIYFLFIFEATWIGRLFLIGVTWILFYEWLSPRKIRWQDNLGTFLGLKQLIIVQ